MDLTPTPCPGLIVAWRLRPDSAAERLDEHAVIAALEAGEAGLWLHLDLVDQRSRGVIAGLPLPVAARAALTEPDEAPHLELMGGALSGAVPDFAFGTDPTSPAADLALLHVALTERLLVTARRHPLRMVHLVAQAPAAGQPAEALAAAMAGVADDMALSMQALADQLAALEEALIRGEAEGLRTPLAALRRRLLHLDRRFTPACTAILALREEADDDPAFHFARPALRPARRYMALQQAFAGLNERARIAQDEIANIAAERTNDRLFVLSVISAAMLPASLVAGIFGMNVGALPGVEEEWGFLMAMTLIVASIGGIIGALRWWRLL
jgi:zinc transporter